MIRIGIDTYGQMIEFPQQYVRIRTGQTIQLNFFVVSTIDESETWDLSSAVLTFEAKQYINDADSALSFADTSTQWSRTNASTGHVALILTAANTAAFEDVSLFGQLTFSINGSIYKSDLVNLSFEKAV